MRDDGVARPAFREAFPMLTAADLPRAVAFYRDAFGFELAFRWPAEGRMTFAYLSLQPLGIGIGAAGQPRVHDGRPATPDRGGVELCVYTDDLDAAYTHLAAIGAPILLEPVTQPWGERLLYTSDPDGTAIMVVQPARDST